MSGTINQYGILRSGMDTNFPWKNIWQAKEPPKHGSFFKFFFFYLDHDIGQNSNVIESQEVGINIVDWVVFVRLLVR